jgi:hypothetical protein
MNTFITRIWLNNLNSFVISESKDKHDAAVAEMVANGDRKLESNVYAHGLGAVVVIAGETVHDT